MTACRLISDTRDGDEQEYAQKSAYACRTEEKLLEYNKMKTEMSNLVLGLDQQTIGVRRFGYNGKHYSGLIPEKAD